MQKLGVPIPVAFVATLAITAVIAAIIGAICVRLKEIYFAFVTLAFQMLIHSTILSWASFTGGDQGLRGGIPRPVFLGIDLANHVHLYIASCALLILGLLAMRQIAQSPFGYTLRMMPSPAISPSGSSSAPQLAATPTASPRDSFRSMARSSNSPSITARMPCTAGWMVLIASSGTLPGSKTAPSPR